MPTKLSLIAGFASRQYRMRTMSTGTRWSHAPNTVATERTMLFTIASSMKPSSVRISQYLIGCKFAEKMAYAPQPINLNCVLTNTLSSTKRPASAGNIICSEMFRSCNQLRGSITDFDRPDTTTPSGPAPSTPAVILDNVFDIVEDSGTTSQVVCL